MWDDWHLENRVAAAEALALSGNGSVMHDDLMKRLNDPMARIRSDAVQKLAEIRRITPGLTAPFLERLLDEQVMVRLDACKAAAIIEPKQVETVHVLLRVVSKDASSNARCPSSSLLCVISSGFLSCAGRVFRNGGRSRTTRVETVSTVARAVH